MSNAVFVGLGFGALALFLWQAARERLLDREVEQIDETAETARVRAAAQDSAAGD